MASNLPLPPLLPPVPNAFRDDFLAAVRQADETAAGGEAAVAGPWHLRPAEAGYEIRRAWEGSAHGDGAFGVFEDWETALLVLAGLPTTGRAPLFTLRGERTERGHPVVAAGEVVGHLEQYDSAVVQAASVLAAVARAPVALAAFLTAAGPLALDQAGQILGRQALGRILGYEEG